MSDDVVSAGFVVTPETIASRTFTTAFRGFDQAEVRAFLRRVSEEISSAAEREAQLRHLLQEAQNRVAHPEVDEALITAALGEHAAKLLSSAREQANAIRAEAEAKAARLMRDAEGQIARIRSEADSLLARRIEEVDGVTVNLRNAAEADARALRDQAQADAEAELQAARAQGREMVGEARAVRERILADLARRRNVAELQLDQLRAARERLLDAYSVVRRTLDEATAELKTAEVEARLAAEEVARRAPEPATHTDDLTPPRGQPPLGLGSPAPSRLATAAARAPRSEPVSRSEPRLRPPGRPGEARPTPPSRRPQEFRPSMEPEPATARRLAPEARPPASAPSPATPPAPEPPSILPRPVPPPPARPVPVSREPTPAPAPRPAPAGPPTGAKPLDTPPDRVDALFARIKADRAVTAAEIEAAQQAERTADAATTAAGAPADPAAATPSPGEVVPAHPAAEPPPPSPSREIADEAARSRRDEAIEPIEANLVRHMKRVLQDEQNEVLDRLRRKRRRDGSPLLRADEQAGRFREAALHLLEQAIKAGAGFAGGSGAADPGAAREIATGLAQEIAAPLRQRLEGVLEEGDDQAARSEALSSVYRQWRVQEIERLSRHAVMVAFSRGAYDAYDDGARLRWVVDDEAPCPDCDDNLLAGDVVKGKQYPTGQRHPPAHPGCCCLLLPVVP